MMRTALVFAFAAAVLSAQSQQNASRTFEVASVKKFEGRVTSTALRTPGGGRITILNMPLRTILVQAWGGLREYQLSGSLPAWITTDRFTINAKAETNAPRNEVMLMLRAVLVDRFQLKYHVEKREMQAYVLTTAEKEWQPTPRMRPAAWSRSPCPIRSASTAIARSSAT